MGKISELDMAISDLRKAAATINDVADTLAEMFNSAATEEAPVREPHLTTIHIAMKPLGRWAYATSVIHLGAAIGVDIAVIIVKLLLGTRDSQIG